MIERVKIGLESEPCDITAMLLSSKDCMYTTGHEQVFRGSTTNALHNIYKSSVDMLYGCLNLTEPE